MDVPARVRLDALRGRLLRGQTLAAYVASLKGPSADRELVSCQRGTDLQVWVIEHL